MESRNLHVDSEIFFGGVGLRPSHYPHLLTQGAGSVQWFEAISENYMDSYGRPRDILRKIRQDHPIALHGVSMSLGSPEGLNPEYLKNLKILIDEIDPFLVSDHLCWSKFGAHYSHDLLPLAYTRETVAEVVQNIQQAQEVLGRPLLIENISAYLQTKNAEFTEWDFLVEICRRSGCRLLLDINNIYVNAKNFNFDPVEYLRAIPADKIGQIHLAGFTDMGTYLFDTHSTVVHEDVWNLFEMKARELTQVPVMIEWDEEVPSFECLENELQKARSVWNKTRSPQKGRHEKSPLL